METSARLLLVYICSAIFMFVLKMVITTGTSHYQLSIVIFQRGGSIGCCIATGKSYATHLSILFKKNK